MTDDATHERGLRRFIAQGRRERFGAALERGGRARTKELHRLHDRRDLDERSICPPFPPVHGDAFVATVIEALGRVAPGATHAYVVSAEPSLDAQTFEVPEALRLAVLCDDGALLSIVPGRVALYTGELVDDTRLLVHPSHAT